MNINNDAQHREEPVLTVRDIMTITGASQDRVYTWINKGRLRAHKISVPPKPPEWRVKQSDFEAFAEVKLATKGATPVLLFIPDELMDLIDQVKGELCVGCYVRSILEEHLGTSGKGGCGNVQKFEGECL